MPKKITAFEGEDAIIKEAACGRDHSILLDTRGRAFGCGWGEYGRLGLGEDVGICLTPTLITIGNNSTDVVASNNFFLVAGAAGREHSLVLDSLGNVFAFIHAVTATACCIGRGAWSSRSFLVEGQTPPLGEIDRRIEN